MEDYLKIWEELLKTVQTLTTWPLIVLYLVLLFRRALTQQIPALFKSFEALAERLATLKYKGLEADFKNLKKLAEVADPKLTREVALKLIETQDTKDQDQPVDE